jgi:hypothetical protein
MSACEPKRTPGTFFTNTAIIVAAGDTFVLSFQKSAGQDFGSLTGVRETIDFTADGPGQTPVPGAAWLRGTVLGGAGFGAWRRRRKSQAA